MTVLKVTYNKGGKWEESSNIMCLIFRVKIKDKG